MHLLFITPIFPFDESDTTCLPPLQALVRELAARPGVRVSVIAVHYPHAAEDYVWNGVRVYACGGSNRYMLRPQTWYRAVECASRINRACPIDAIHSIWLGECAVIGRWLERKYNRPHWVTLAGQDARPENPFLSLFTLGMLNLVAVSEVQAGVYELSTGRAVQAVIPWGLDEKQFAPPAEPVERDVDILGVGPFLPHRNWPLFFDAVKIVAERTPDVKVSIVGGGEEKLALEELRRAHGLGEVVKFAGPKSRPRTLEWMRRSRALLNASHYEAFGYAMLEASASGCRVVSTPVGVAPELPFCEMGETAEELAELVLSALAERDAPPGQVHFSVKDTADGYLQLAKLETVSPVDDIGKGGDFGGSQ